MAVVMVADTATPADMEVTAVITVDTMATVEGTVATVEDTVATVEDTVATAEDMVVTAEDMVATAEDTVACTAAPRRGQCIPTGAPT
jgi:hypothetical protein